MTGRARLAGALGLLGGSLGVAAGVLQAMIGSRISDWSGNKNSPVALGLLTIALSGVALYCSALLYRKTAPSPGRRVATSVGLLVPGGLCFSTVGVLWYLPGALLLVASGTAIASGTLRESRSAVAAHWLRGLVSTLGAFELLMAAGAGPAFMTVGGLGGMALIAAPWMSSRPLRLCLLLLGAIPFAALTWWSLVSPLVGLLALSIGLPALARRAAAARQDAAQPTEGQRRHTDAVRSAMPRLPVVEPTTR